MSSSARFTRGTSIIAALVFAAILGAVALSLNTLQSNSANTAALPADPVAASTATGSANPASTQPADSIDQTCVDGADFDDTLPGTVTSTSVWSGTTAEKIQSQKKENHPCLTDAAATAEIQQQYKSIPPSQWKSSITLPPNEPSRVACKVGDETTTPTASNACTYLKQSDNTYKLQTWTCNVRIFAPGLTLDPSEECQIYHPSPGQTVDPSTLLQSPPPSASSGAGTVPPNSDGTCPTGSTATYPDGYDPVCQSGILSADDKSLTTPAGAVPLNSDGTCPSGSTATYPDGYDLVCQAGSQTPAQSPGVPPNSDGTCPEGSTATYPDGYDLVCQTSSATTPAPGQTCPTGQVGTPPNCTPITNSPPPNNTNNNPNPTPVPTNTNGNNSNNGSLGALTSFLSGLMKGLSPCTAQSTSIGGNGTTLVPVQVLNPTTGQITTTYVQQQTAGANQPCAQQQSPYGTGSNGVACNAPPAVPQCAAGATAQPTSSQGNGCVDGYQCVPTSSTFGQTPTPQISCSPQTADVGESIAISYSCENATGSSGGGFSTNNQLSGSATSTIAAPPSGTNTANYGLTCTNNGQTASAQCSVQVSQPAIDLVADPQFVQSGTAASIGWVTAGMQSCVISSPQDTNFTEENSGNQSVNGVAQTDAITGNTEFDLTCQTLGGETQVASTIVSLGSATSTSAASVSVSSTADGQTANHGDTVTITWNASTTASDSAVALWLIDVNSEEATALIASDQALSGSYQWQLPSVGSTCDQNTDTPCAGNLVDGDSYGIEAALYTPQSAYLGPDNSPPSGDTSPTYTDYGYTSNTFTIGQ